MWLQTGKYKNARTGILKTRHGKVETPCFMPVATQGTVKHLTTAEVRSLGYQLILSNTYHLMSRPGTKLVKQQGGLHRFMDWSGAILTDSGGFQVFSLARRSFAEQKNDKTLVRLTDKGVKFQSPYDGAWQILTPASVIKLQADLGVDIAVCLDECVALPASLKYLEQSVALTTAWARQSRQAWLKLKNRPLLFAVIQGGLDRTLRLKSLADLEKIGFDGYNIGGLSVGENAAQMYRVLDYLVSAMPETKPRYLMGVGRPENILEAVKRGVDLFDCVIPSREGRHGRLFSWVYPRAGGDLLDRRGKFYQTLNINNAKFAKDKTLINSRSRLPELRAYSKAYLHHLFKVNEPLGQRLATLNNLEFYSELMAALRANIKNR